MSNNSNRTNVPEAREAMDKFKMEVANEIGVPLTNGYNGNLTSAQNGSVGGYMVKKSTYTTLPVLALSAFTSSGYPSAAMP